MISKENPVIFPKKCRIIQQILLSAKSARAHLTTPKKEIGISADLRFFRFSFAFSVYFSSPEVLPAMPVSMPPMGQIVTISSSSNPPAPA